MVSEHKPVLVKIEDVFGGLGAEITEVAADEARRFDAIVYPWYFDHPIWFIARSDEESTRAVQIGVFEDHNKNRIITVVPMVSALNRDGLPLQISLEEKRMHYAQFDVLDMQLRQKLGIAVSDILQIALDYPLDKLEAMQPDEAKLIHLP